MRLFLLLLSDPARDLEDRTQEETGKTISIFSLVLDK